MTESAARKADVTIIGAGPVGLFAVFACGMMRLKCQVVDTLDEVGGQCAALYPEKPIYDIPAFPATTGAELTKNLYSQAAAFSPHYYLGQTVIDVTRTPQGTWCVQTEKHHLETPVVLMASGGGALQPNKPPLADIEKYEDKAVFYAIRNKEQFRAKTIVIAGGGDSAVDWAIDLAPLAKKVYFVHRRAQFRAAASSVAELKALVAAGKVEEVIPCQLAGLKGNEAKGELSHVVVKTLSGEEREIPADVLLPFFGLKSDSSVLERWGLALEHHRILVDPTTCASNLEGVYAVGDSATYPCKRKLILTGFSEAGQAAQAIYGFLNPDTPVHTTYSTTSGIPVL